MRYVTRFALLPVVLALVACSSPRHTVGPAVPPIRARDRSTCVTALQTLADPLSGLTGSTPPVVPFDRDQTPIFRRALNDCTAREWHAVHSVSLDLVLRRTCGVEKLAEGTAISAACSTQ